MSIDASGGTPTGISIYDLDRTITSVPTWTLFLLYAAWRIARWRLLLVPLLPLTALGKAMRLYDRDRLKEVMHRLMLGRRVPASRIDAVADAFGAMIVARHIRPGARAAIAADRAAGRRIVIATASHAFVAGGIARRIGADDLIATQARRDRAGDILNRLAGANCYGDAKQDAILRWLADAGFAREDVAIRFYTDHVSDRATLGWADEPVAVNPSRALRTLAMTMGWPIRDWGTPRNLSKDASADKPHAAASPPSPD